MGIANVYDLRGRGALKSRQITLFWRLDSTSQKYRLPAAKEDSRLGRGVFSPTTGILEQPEFF
jgi:hypothetical protein